VVELESKNGEALYGEVSGLTYPFDLRPRLFVDSRDVVFLLHPGVTEVIE